MKHLLTGVAIVAALAFAAPVWAGTLRPNWCGKCERSDDRYAGQEMLHDFDPPLQFRVIEARTVLFW